MSKQTLKLSSSQKGFPLLKYLLKRFMIGDTVVVKPFTKNKNQLPNKRFFGKIGTVTEINKKSTVVKIEGSKKRTKSIKYINTSNLHLKLIKSKSSV